MRFDENQILNILKDCEEFDYYDLVNAGISPDMIARLKQSWDRLKYFQRQKKATSGLLNFTQYTTPEFEVNWHHRLVCETLDEFLDFNSGLDRLIIQMPPRTSKSELASRKLPAFAFGKYPDLQIIATSYSADLASRMNRDVQRVIDSPQYREIFPEIGLSGKNIAKSSLGSYVRTSDMFEIVGHKGAYRSAGIGGGITGMGADIAICLPYEAKITTEKGKIQIGDIVTKRMNIKIKSFNHDTMKMEWDDIDDWEINPPRDFCIITTTTGRELTVTRDHPVWIKGLGYTQADEVRPSDVVLVDQNGKVKFEEVKDNVVRENFKKTFNIRIRKNHNYFASDILVHNCDDPFKDWKDANSPTMVKSIIEWYDSVLSTRLSKKGKILIIQTRWSERDLAGYLIEQTKKNSEGDQFKVLSFPMIFDSEHEFNHPLDPRTDGEVLWPSFFPEKRVYKFKNSISKAIFSSLYQQSPAPTEGNMVKKDDIRKYTDLPKMEHIYISLDSNFKESADSDFVVIGVWGTSGKYKYLLEVFRDQVGFTKTKDKLISMIKKYRRINEVIIEAKANGEAIMDTLKNDKEMTVPIYGFSPTDSKAARLSSVLPEFESGLVMIPDTDDERYAHMDDVIQKYVTELTTFPKAKNDDMVDMTTQFLIRFRENNFAWLDYVDDAEVAASDEFEDLAERMGWKPSGMGLGF